MKIAITGSTGLVGSALLSQLSDDGHSIQRIVRKSPGDDDVLWDVSTGEFAASRMENTDAVVHLAGENVGEGRWTNAKKARILDSRVEGTRLLCESLAKMSSPPQTLVAASAIGFYGSRGDEICTESSDPGTGFLAEVCAAWEAETKPAVDAGIRVVNLRIGVVLSPQRRSTRQNVAAIQTLRRRNCRQRQTILELDFLGRCCQHDSSRTDD